MVSGRARVIKFSGRARAIIIKFTEGGPADGEPPQPERPAAWNGLGNAAVLSHWHSESRRAAGSESEPEAQAARH